MPVDTVPSGRASKNRAVLSRRTMAALTASPDVFETFFDRAEIGLAIADLSGCYVRTNATYAALLGQRAEDLIGAETATYLQPANGSDDSLQNLLSGATTAVSSEQQHVAADGRVRWLLHGVTVVLGSDRQPAWLAVSAQDITERRQAEHDLRALSEVLAEQAVRDPLTGLANRVLLEERMRAALARDARSGSTTGVLFLDLDGFKAVNDEHGHAAGDDVLVEVAGRLAEAVRPSDTVARLGGDEFVVLVEGVSLGELPLLADRLRTAVARPLHIEGERGQTLDLHVGVSIGEATSVAGADDPAGLVSRADSRMYAAKDGGSGRSR